MTAAQVFTYTLTGKLASVTDAAGTRTFTYNEYDELMTDSLTADEVTHVITENRDEYGRGIGYGYAKDNNVQQSVSYGYGNDGRLSTAAFSHGGESRQFGFSYLSGSNMLQTLTMPNGKSLTQEFETQRDLLTAMLYKRGTTGVVERSYTYDAGRRPLTRIESRLGSSRSDSFTHNNRSELTAATIGDTSYSYTYDNIGNRKTAQENAEEATAYTANNLNQYTAVGNFVPEFDADGKAADGCKADWTHAQRAPRRGEGAMGCARVNAENRPVTFSRVNEDGSITQVTCAYDYMGRRTSKKVETITTDAETAMSSASTTLHQRYLYRGYLQIACCDLTRSAHPCLWLITWDPTQSPRRPVGGLDNSGAVAPEGRGRNGVRPSQPVATRPLAIQKDGTWYCYGWDLTKNICEVFNYAGYINNTVTYSYTPYGAVTAEGSASQPLQWSSEFYDDELGLVYYNYRHYNPADGRWLRRDPLRTNSTGNLYHFGNSEMMFDFLGLDGENANQNNKANRTPTKHAYYAANIDKDKLNLVSSDYNFIEEFSNSSNLVEKIKKNLASDCSCVKRLLIITHGADGIGPLDAQGHSFFSGNTQDVKNLGSTLSHYMCKDAKIIFTACYAGNMAYYLEPFTNALGAPVIAASDKVEMALKLMYKPLFGDNWKIMDNGAYRPGAEPVNTLGVRNNGYWIKYSPHQTKDYIYPGEAGISNNKKTHRINHIITTEKMWNL